MRRLAEIAHKHGISMTWAIDAASARALSTDLTRWHESHGDEPLLMVDIAPIWGTDADSDEHLQSAEHIVTMREKLPDYISSEWDKVERAMAWASPVVAGAVQKNHVLLYALAEVGFAGLWGYRWREAGTDDGCPFGLFYPSADRHNFCGTPTSRMVGIPDASVHPAQMPPSSDAEIDTANLRTQLLKGTARQTFDLYVNNAAWNAGLAYVQQIDAAEVTLLTSEQLDQLDSYLAYVCEAQEAQVMALSKAVREYQQIGEGTQPTFLIVNSPSETRAPSSNTSAKSTLFYYDTDCQLVFEDGKMEPIGVTNYVSPPVSSPNGAEFSLPQIEDFRPRRSRSRLQMQFVLESPKGMPYGFAIWGNHAGLTLATTNVQAVTWLGDRLLFVRADLHVGKNEIEVVLTI
ncbi:MAG: hypothetical protein O7E52_04740 [Candidatus Poribacteria bacterium]|nr:hypothetical protein [Candidatus Poribacteria bacterium]